MKPFPTTGDDSKPDSYVQKIIAGTLGIPISLSAAPTTSGNQLSTHGDIGYNGSNLYIRLGATTYKITMTAV